MSLLTELDACTWTTASAASWTPASMGAVVWFDCGCGARIARRADEGDALDVDG